MNINEGNNLIRFITKLKNPDSKFAIIGTNDKNTNESKYRELVSLVNNIRNKRPDVGYKNVRGVYTYIEDGSTTDELTLIIDNIGRSESIELARAINQESYIVKDGDFFGLVNTDGKILDKFSKDLTLVKDEEIENALTRFISKHNEGNKAFKFTATESYLKGGIITNHDIYNGTETIITETLFTCESEVK